MSTATLGRELRRARHNAGLTLAQVSARTGVNISTLSMVERGLMRGSINVLEKLAAVYGLRVVVSLSPLGAQAGRSERDDVAGEGGGGQ